MRLGFIGLGIMGGAMAANLLKAGWALVVHDIRPQAVALEAQRKAARDARYAARKARR